MQLRTLYWKVAHLLIIFLSTQCSLSLARLSLSFRGSSQSFGGSFQLAADPVDSTQVQHQSPVKERVKNLYQYISLNIKYEIT